MTTKANPWWSLIRFGFRLLYNEFAFSYDVVSKVVSLGAWHCWQRSALKHLAAAPGAPILELAFGTGNVHLDLHEAGYRVFGHDLSPNMAQIARKKLVRRGFSVHLTRGLAQQLPYRSATFAAVVSTFPAEFILAPETVREVYRVLAPGGRFIIVPNGVLTAGGALASAIEGLYRITGQRDNGTTQNEVHAFFGKVGFDVTVVQEPCPRSLATVIIAEKKV